MRTLQECQDELVARGVQDVKFCWDPGFRRFGPDTLKKHVAEFLSDYLDGNYTEMPFIGDKKTS